MKAAFGFDAIVGNFASPDTPGSAYVLLHHIFGEVNGKKGAWGHAIGGIGAITGAMREACEEAGVIVDTDIPVSRVLVEGGRATGVLTEAGERIAARAIVSNVGPRLLYDRLFDQDDLPAEFRRRVRGFKVGSGTFRMNVALSELPRFVASTMVPAFTVMAFAVSWAVTASNNTRSREWPTNCRRKRTKAVRSGVASVPEKPQKRRNDARSSSASASFTSDRSYQTASSMALNIAKGGQAGSPFVAG